VEMLARGVCFAAEVELGGVGYMIVSGEGMVGLRV